MEEIKSTETVPEINLPEIPPIFNIAQNKKNEKSSDGIIFYRVTASVLIAVSFIILKMFFPDIFIVMDSWLIDKFAFPL
ncbi:MAG: hypothetical protein LBC86_06050 [Oscillospiraceae bacterium]|nr:hypothetical protein [Oscillospiraceae bacterium]